jgi:phosphotransferase system HPr (HPr) family protein
MVERFELTYSCGLHARPALALYNLAKLFDAKIIIKNISTGKKDTLDSIFNILTLGIQPGTIEFETTGKQDKEAMEAISKFINNLNIDNSWV